MVVRCSPTRFTIQLIFTSDLDIFGAAETSVMEDLPLFPDLDLEEGNSLDLTDLDMSGLDRVHLVSTSSHAESVSSFDGLDEVQLGETFVDLNRQFPAIVKVSVANEKDGCNKKSATTTARSAKENERNRKRVPEAKAFTNDDRDTNSDSESVSSNVLRRKNDGNLSKNAIAARENRLKKKKYIEELENKCQHFTKENAALKKRVEKQESTISHLETDNAYLRNVLANVDEISALISKIKDTPGVKFTSSLKGVDGKRKSDCDLDHEYCSPPAGKKRRSQASTSSSDDNGAELIQKDGTKAGVCLHVAGGTVSLEFCPNCNSNVSRLQQQAQEGGDDW